MQEWKRYVEFDVPENVCVFDTKAQWKNSKLKGFLDIQIVTAQRMRAKFDNRKITKEEIVSKIGGVEYLDEQF